MTIEVPIAAPPRHDEERDFGFSTVSGALVLFAFALFAGPLLSQSHFARTFDESNGLPSVQVYGIVQDDQGLVWAATRSGCCVYDGKTWKVVCGLKDLGPNWEPHFIVNAAGSGVMVIPDHLQYEIYRLEDDEILKIPSPGVDVANLAAVAAVSVGSGDDQRLILACNDASIRVWSRSEDSWSRLRTPPGSTAIRSLAATTDERLLVVSDSGVHVGDGKTWDRLTPKGEARWSNLLDAHLSGDPSNPGLVYLDVEEAGILKDGVATPFPNIKNVIGQVRAKWGRIISDGFDGYYFLTDDYLAHGCHPRRGIPTIRINNVCSRGEATDFLVDHERNLWVANLRGVHFMPPPRFLNWANGDGIPFDEVGALLEMADGSFVAGHFGKISFLKEGRVEHLEFPEARTIPLRLKKILDLAPAPNGGVWMAGHHLGLGLMDASRKVTWWPLTDSSSPASSSGIKSRIGVAAVLPLGPRHVLVGSSSGLWEFRDGKFTARGSDILKGLVRRVFRNAKGEVFLASVTRGVLQIDVQTGDIQSLPLPDDRASRDVFCFAEDRRGRLWIGTRGGVYVWDGKKVAEPEHLAQRIPGPIYGVTLVDDGRIAFGTTQGIVFSDEQFRFRYGVDDGLSGMEVNRAALVSDSLGRIWIGTNNGLSLHDRRFEDMPLEYGRLRIVSAKSRGKSLEDPDDADATVELDGRDLTFTVNCPSYRYAGRNQYRMRLLGLGDEWIEGDDVANGTIHFENLPPGSYRLEAQTRLPVGDWSDSAYSPLVTISSPFWKRAWFIGALVALIGLSAFFVTKFIGNNRIKEDLETMVARRTKELEKSERHFREAFQSNRAAQVQLNTNNLSVIAANPAACRLYGYSEEDIFGRAFPDFSGEQSDAVAQMLDSLEQDQGLHRYIEQVNASGDKRDIEIFASRVETTNGWVIQCTVHDVTDSKRIEREHLEAQKLHAVGRLASGIAHDFNNLLVVIQGNAEVAERKANPRDAINRELAEIKSATKRGTRMIRDLLAFSRRSTLKREVFTLDAYFDELLPTLAQLLGPERRLQVELEAGATHIAADRVQFERVMSNLITNARDATEPGGTVTLRTRKVSVASSPLKTDTVSIEVIDDGVGIPEHARERIFEPFFTTKEAGKGTGLGLASAHGIIVRSGGRLEMESKIGSGSTFRIYLPTVSESRQSRPVSGTVLIVDAEGTDRRFLARCVREIGFEARTANSGGDAMRIMREAPDGIVALVADLHIPEMAGDELALTLREERPDLNIILTSGIRARPVDLDNMHFIEKPVSARELARLLRPSSNSNGRTTDGHA